jgi:AAA+ ATPase superfamily predicted ATPase
MNLNVGKPVTGAELIGREREITEIIQTLKAGQSVALIAPRRFGKTSVLMEALNRLEKEKYFTGSVDIFTIPDPGRLAFEITKQEQEA